MEQLGREEQDRKIILPGKLDDYVSPENPVRLFDAFVDSLDFVKLGFVRSVPVKEGRPGYNPRDLMKLYIYGYFYDISSSYYLARACGLNLEVMWLIKKLKPDFRTIFDFRKNNKESMEKVLKEFNKFCCKLGLFSLRGFLIDERKSFASNLKNDNFTLSKLDNVLKMMNNYIAEYMKKLDSEDRNDEALIKEHEKRRAEHERHQKEMQEKK